MPYPRNRRLITHASALSLLLWACLPARLRAEEPAPVAGPRPDLGYWSTGKPRLFLSTRSELGLLYVKPYLSAGYGQPHWIWGGVDANAMSTLEFAQWYAGVRAATPLLDLAFGLRDTWSFQKALLQPARSFSRADVLDAPGPSAHYLAWEGEAVAILPLPYSALVADFIFVRTQDVPQGRLLYEENYRAIVADPLFFTLRTAAVARLLRQDALKVGLLTEYVFGTGRPHDVVRVGPVAALQLTDHLQAQVGVTFAVHSPDRLGLVLGAYGVAGLRYQWASGERNPQPPWRGRLIP